MTGCRLDVSAVPLQGSYVAKRCPVRAQNDILRPGEPVPPSAFLERLFEGGRRFEAEIFERFRSLHPDAVFVDGEDAAACTEATVAALTDGDAIVLGGQLPIDEAGRRVGKPDVLVPAASGGWRAVDVKHHMTLSARNPDGPKLDALCSELAAPGFERSAPDVTSDRRKHKDDMLQLAHYQRMLEAAGLAPDDGRFGGIVGVEGVVTWHDLDEPIWRTPSASCGTKLRSTMEVYDFEFAFRLDIMAVAQAHQEDKTRDLLVVPVRIAECDSCPWVECCMEVLEAGSGDVSLLPRIGWREWKAYREHGVHDRASLARLDPAGCQDWGVGSLPEHVDLARAALGPEPVYRRRGVDEVVVPRGDVEVDVDMESVEEGCYLWGAFSTDRAGTGIVPDGYQAFATWEPLGGDAEIENFRDFWRWLTELRAAVEARGLVFRAYCYSASAEGRFLRSQGAAAGVLEEVEAFIASDAWVDLLPIFRDQLITGHGNGLKEVAPLAGFEWPVDDAGGADAMLAYDEAVEGEDRERARRWLLSYNEGDVEATRALREWLGSEASGIPSIAEVRVA